MSAASRVNRIFSKSIHSLKIPHRAASTKSFYVLLPEIPPDTAETNPLLRLTDYPKFSAITPDNVVTGCAKLALNYDVEVGKHLESLKDLKSPKTFSSVLEPIEQYSVPLSFGWSTSKNLSYTNGGDFRSAFQRVHQQTERAKNERWLSVPLYNAVKEVAADEANLDEFQQRLVQMYLLEAKLNGIELDGSEKKKFMSILGNLIEAKNSYRNKVMLSHNLFSHVIDDFGLIATMPKDVASLLAADKMHPSRGPWKVTLNQNVYIPFLEHCPDRTQRWNVWKAFNSRASLVQDQQNLSNHVVIKDIRQYRRDLARMLGFETFADMAMETKMAGSMDNVLNLLESLKAKFKPLAEEELANLTEFAHSEGFNGKLKPWDLAYWSRRQKEHLYRLDIDLIPQYFPLPTVLHGLFELFNEFFGIVIKDSSGTVDTWHSDVSFYQIYDAKSGEQLSSFYLDPYTRPGKLAGNWFESGRGRSSLHGTQALSYLNLSLTPGLSGNPALLSYDEVLTLVYEMGHGLQQLLTIVPYSEISGQRNLAWDVLQVVPLVLRRLLSHPSTMSMLSGHHQSGDPIPPDTLKLLNNRRHHFYAFNMMKQLYYSAFDLEVHVSEDHWNQVMQKVWREFVPLPLDPDDHHPCSLTAIFCDQYAASYYSMKWAEMVAADICRTFEDAGIDSTDSIKPIGQRFRDTFLSLGGGLPASHVFRQFQGRDPDETAFLNYYPVAEH